MALELFWAALGRLCGSSWAALGTKSIAKQNTKHIFQEKRFVSIFTCFLYYFCTSWGLRTTLASLLGGSGRLLDGSGPLLGGSGRRVGGSGRILGGSWAALAGLGRLWAAVGRLSGSSGAALGGSFAALAST